MVNLWEESGVICMALCFVLNEIWSHHHPPPTINVRRGRDTTTQPQVTDIGQSSFLSSSSTTTTRQIKKQQLETGLTKKRKEPTHNNKIKTKSKQHLFMNQDEVVEAPPHHSTLDRIDVPMHCGDNDSQYIKEI